MCISAKIYKAVSPIELVLSTKKFPPRNYFRELFSHLTSTTFLRQSTQTATMVTKSKLKMALDHDKGTDYKQLNLKKKEKLARKVKKSKQGGEKATKKADEEWEDVDEVDEVMEDDAAADEEGSDEEAGAAPMQVCWIPAAVWEHF